MTDKAIHEKDVLMDGWPNARQLLCGWYVETWLKRQCSKLGNVVKKETKELKVIMKGLVNAESQQQYDDLKVALLAKLDNDRDNMLYKSFMTHWDTTTDEWVMFKRGEVPHLKNNTNNRLESKWGRLKEIVDGSFTIDELISMLITMQQYAEERYLAEFHRVSGRPPIAEDPELTAVAMQLSDYAFKMVVQQHAFAVGPNTTYDIETTASGKTKVVNPRTGNSHEVDARLSTCDCIFRQTCLLPCRHIMYVRATSNYETVLPPMRHFVSRWIVNSAANNIDTGDVAPGGVNRVNCPSPKAPRAVTSGQKYSQGKQPTEKIVDVLSIQPSTTFRLAMKWLKGFHVALHTGKLEAFTGQDLSDTSCFPGLSQVSSVGDVTLSQLSFADTGVAGQLKEKPQAQTQATDIANSITAATKSPVQRGAVSAPMSRLPDTVQINLAEKTKEKGSVQAADKGSVDSPIVFASPPRRKGLTRRAEKQAASNTAMREAKKLRLDVSDGRKTRTVKLSDMTILSGPYSRFTVKPLVDKVNLLPVEVAGTLDIRRFNVGQPVPVVKAIPQREKIREALGTTVTKQQEELLARWGDYGFATYGQLQLMETVISARNNFSLVEATIDWIDAVEFRVDSIVAPFKDVENVTKATHKNAVDGLNLERWYVGRHAQYGSEFLDYRENVWLHTGSIIGGLLVLRQTYEDVGVVNPRFHDFDHPDQKMRTAKRYDAAEPGIKTLVSAINLSKHWGAFVVKVDTATCCLFDPMQLQSNLSVLKQEVPTVIEGMIGMTDQLRYEVITGCKQKDSSSCGVWCLIVLELLLFCATPKNWSDYWNDSLYDVVGYLRMRYLYKVIGVQHELSVAVDGDE